MQHPLREQCSENYCVIRRRDGLRGSGDFWICHLGIYSRASSSRHIRNRSLYRKKAEFAPATSRGDEGRPAQGGLDHGWLYFWLNSAMTEIRRSGSNGFGM